MKILLSGLSTVKIRRTRRRGSSNQSARKTASGKEGRKEQFDFCVIVAHLATLFIDDIPTTNMNYVVSIMIGSVRTRYTEILDQKNQSMISSRAWMDRGLKNPEHKIDWLRIIVNAVHPGPRRYSRGCPTFCFIVRDTWFVRNYR